MNNMKTPEITLIQGLLVLSAHEKKSSDNVRTLSNWRECV